MIWVCSEAPMSRPRFCACVVAVLWIAFQPAAFSHQPDPFSFGKVELDVLAQVDLLDQKFERDGFVFADAGVDAYLGGIERRILADTPTPEHVRWRIRVLRDPLVNAFALPNGSIYLNSGLIALMEDEDQLASIIAHEMVHVRDRHTYLAVRGYRKKMAALHVIQAATSVAGFAPAGSIWGASLRVVGAATPAILAAMIDGYSRDLERRADLSGANRLMDAGYRGREMAAAFEHLGNGPEVEVLDIYYGDHPKLLERIAYVHDLVAQRYDQQAVETAEQHRTRTDSYFTAVEPVIRHNVLLDLSAGRNRAAVHHAARLVARHPDSADDLCLLADAYAALGPMTATPGDQELSSDGRSAMRKMRQRLTSQELDARLLGTDAGRTAARANQTEAERLYREALERFPAAARPHRGLAFLFEKQGNVPSALTEYAKYLELAPDAADRPRIESRLANLKAKLGSAQ
jgi:predicted Zn-dependent protease